MSSSDHEQIIANPSQNNQNIKRLIIKYIEKKNKNKLMFFFYLYQKNNDIVDFVNPQTLSFLDEKTKLILLSKLDYSLSKYLLLRLTQKSFLKKLGFISLILVLFLLYIKNKLFKKR